MIKAVIFDLDDTLFSESEFVRSGFRAVSDWIESHYQKKNFFEIAEQLFAEGKRGNLFNLALERLGVCYDQVFIHLLVTVYREHVPKLLLYEDSKWAIEYFKQRKKIGIITDGYFITQQNKVVALGIENEFNIIVYSDQYGRENWKPSKVPYLKVMENLGCQGDECVYIGDNPSKDFITANSLGWQTIQICRDNGEYSGLCKDDSHNAVFQISSLYELKSLILE